MMTLAMTVITASIAATPAPMQESPSETVRESAREMPPIATSRFAPDRSSIRELRALGKAAPPPPGGELVVGPPLEAWSEDGYTLLVFWSPFVGGASEHVGRLGQVVRDTAHIDGVSIAFGPRDQVEAALADLPGRDPVIPRTIIDSEDAWRDTFLAPLGLTSLPAVVAIDREGRVSYHASLRGMDQPLSMIVADTWNPDDYATSALEYAARMNLTRVVEEGRSLARRDQASIDQVLETLREGLRLDPRNTPLLVKEFDILLADADRPEEAYEVGRRIMEAFPTSPITLNDLAWHVVSFPNVRDRDLDFALEASRRANAIQGWMDYGQLDTLARVHWMRGDESEAVRVQRMAAGLAPDTWYGDAVRANLEAYTDGRLAPGDMPPRYRSPRQPR
ncbi:MAG: hypothetical protein GY895_17090 [Phycisphaera sp.]|nr:hypothetical protein [Phycisphaera sp.]